VALAADVDHRLTDRARGVAGITGFSVHLSSGKIWICWKYFSSPADEQSQTKQLIETFSSDVESIAFSKKLNSFLNKQIT
jgi:hypothetical protein